MRKLIAGYAALWLALLALTPVPAQSQISGGGPTGPNAPYILPNVALACGTDQTAIIQAALTTNGALNLGAVSLPPCPKSNCALISSTLLVPSNTSLLGLATGVTCLKEANAANLQPMVANSSFNCTAATLCNTNIEVGYITLDGNGSNQTAAAATRCAYFVGVSNVSVHDLEVDNCTSDAVSINGNGAAGVEPAFANRIFVNTTIGLSSDVTAGTGFTVGNRQRNASVSNIVVLNAASHGVLIDASESNWSSITAKASGTGSSCTNATTHTADNPGTGASNYNWSPCPANVYVRNVTNVSVTNVLSSQGQYHGFLVVGARHTAISNVTSTNSSRAVANTWDDAHLDLNVFNSYGESHDLTITGLTVGANSQAVTSPNQTLSSSPPTARYGLSIADGLAGSVGDVAVAGGGTSYAFSNSLTLSGGTSSIAGKLTVATAPGGIIATVNHDYTTGAGVYTVLPSNPVAVTGGAGSGATFNITWSTASITGVTIGATVTAPTRLPAFHTGWTVQTNLAAIDPTGLPTLSTCGGGSPAMTAGSSNFEGSLTVGSATATCTMTFATLASGAAAFTTVKKCIVTSRSTLAAFAYACTTSGIVFTATTLGGDVIDYEVDAQ